MDINKLLQALDNENNENLLNLNTKKMRTMTLNILKELNLSKEETDELYDKLIEYKYIDEIKDLKQGTTIRWISLTNPEDIKLSKSAILCDYKIYDNCTNIICKHFNYPYKIFQLSMDKNLIFQKLTEQEKILLFALDHI